MTSDTPIPNLTDDAAMGIDIDAEIARLLAPPEETVMVVLAVQNSAVINGHPVLVPSFHEVTLGALVEIQAILDRGTSANIHSGPARATKELTELLGDGDLAAKATKRLIEVNVLKDTES